MERWPGFVAEQVRMRRDERLADQAAADTGRSPQSPARAEPKTELEKACREMAKNLPVRFDPDFSPVLRLLSEGLTEADIRGGIAAAAAEPGFVPQAWFRFEGWIRREGKQRLAGECLRGACADGPWTRPFIRKPLRTTASSISPSWSWRNAAGGGSSFRRRGASNASVLSSAFGRGGRSSDG